MRQIKFRGKVLDTSLDAGRIVYGSFVEYAEKFQGSTHWIIPLNDDRGYPVEPESVAQFVGFDVDGKEVYDGDTVTNEQGEIFQAFLIDAVLTNEGFFHSLPTEIFKLKEAPENEAD